MSPKRHSAIFTDASTKTAYSIKEIQIDDSNLFSSFARLPHNLNLLKHVSEGRYDLATEYWASYIRNRSAITFPKTYISSELSYRSLIDEADFIGEHKIRTSGNRRTDFGKEINFVSLVKEHRLLELHSLPFLCVLADAYRATKSAKYASFFQEILTRWFEQHLNVQPSTGAHPVWNESGCGIRIISILNAYNEMKSENVFTPDLHKIVVKIVLSSARWLYRSQEEFRPGASAYDACAGLVLAGVFFPELHESQNWIARGIKRLFEKTLKEFNDEGAYAEMSDAFALKVLDRCVFVYELLNYNNTASRSRLPKSFGKSLASFAEYFVKTCTPAVTTNPFNDSAYILLASRFREWSRIFRRNDFLYPVSHLFSESPQIKTKAPQYISSQNFPLSGKCIMRNGQGKNVLYMAVEYSAHDSHSHCETTNFSVFAFGKPMVIDRGRGITPDDPYNFFLRTSRLHSMVSLADDNIDIKAKYARVNKWYSSNIFDLLALEHDGYKKKFKALVRRTILFVKPHYWIISDAVIKPKRTVKATSYIHTLPVLFIEKDGFIKCRQAPGIAIAYPSADKHEFIKERAVANLADFEHEMQWTDYIGFRKNAKAGKGTTFMMVIYPYEMVPPELKAMRLEVFPVNGRKPVEPLSAEAFEINASDSKYVFFISHGKPLTYRFANIITDARTGILNLNPKGEPLCLFLADAGYFEINGKLFHKSKKPATVEKILHRAKK